MVIEKITSEAQKTTVAFQQNLMEPEIRKAGTEQVREKARESVLERLARGKAEADRKNRERWEHQERMGPAGKRNMEI